MTYFNKNPNKLIIGDAKPEKTVKVKKTYKYVKKPTGEKAVFESIWNERPHKCQVCGVAIKEPTPSNFAHVLPKAQNKYPKFKLNKQNIMLMCEDCHYTWDFKRGSIIQHGIEKWIMLSDLEKSLKEQYKSL